MKCENSDTEKTEQNFFRSVSKKTWIMIAGITAAVLVLLVLIVVVSSNMSAGGKFDMMDREVIYKAFDDETIYFLTNGEKVDSRLDAEKLESWNTSMDGNVAYFTVKEGKDVVLYVLSGKDVLYVTENADQVMMTETGSAVAYIENEELYLYDVNKASAEKVATEVESLMTISPDGKTVAFMGLDDMTYLCNEGKLTEMTEETTVVSISNGGKYIYCIEMNEEDVPCLYLYNLKGNVGLVAEDVNTENATFYTNKEHTQLIFQAMGRSDYKWYAVEKKELEDEKHDLSSTDLFAPVVPVGAQRYDRDGLIVLGVESLSGMAYSTADVDDETAKLVFVNSGWETSILVSKVTNIQINANGDKIYYMKSGRLFSIEAKARAQSNQLADDVVSYVITSDGKTVYYIDENEILYYQKGEKNLELSEDVQQLYVTHDGYALFVSEDSLYSADGSKTSTVVDDFEAGYVITAADCTYYAVEEDASLTFYISANGLKFKDIGVLLEDSKFPEVQ